MIIYIDIDNTIADYNKAYYSKIDTIQYPQAEYGFFANLELIKDAKSAVYTLLAEGHDVYFLTAPSIYNPMSYTEKAVWVEKHFRKEMLKNLIIAHDKKLLKGDLLIDDTYYDFEGRFIKFGSNAFSNWITVLKEILSYE